MFSPPAVARYICSRWIRSHRRRCYSSLTDSVPPPPPLSGAAKLTNRRLISVHGIDAPKFLQGIVTANVRPESRSGFYTAFLTAQGKVLHDAFIYPTLGSKWSQDANDDEQGYLIDVDGDQTDVLLKHLKRHKLRSKFKLRVLEDRELDVWSVWKEDDRWTAHTKAESERGVLTLTDSRAPGMGQRLLLPPSSARSDLQASLGDEVQEAPQSAYRIRRFMKGVPEGQIEIPRDDSLPMNCNIDLMGGIDFKKGCYLGQELTIRTHHTGVVRRRVLPVALYDSGQEMPRTLQYEAKSLSTMPESHADIKRDDKRRRATGRFIAGVGNIGLAMCRLEQMSDLTISAEGSSFSPEDRFIVQSADGSEIGIKAFVPDWIRGQIREPKVQKRVG